MHKLFSVTLISCLNSGGGLHSSPGLGLWDELCEALHVVFFPWSKPWLCMGTELGDYGAETPRCGEPVRPSSEWFLNECQHLPPQAALNLYCLYFLDFLWLFVCFWKDGTFLFLFLKIGHLRIGDDTAVKSRPCGRVGKLLKDDLCAVVPHTGRHIIPVCSERLKCKHVSELERLCFYLLDLQPNVSQCDVILLFYIYGTGAR